MAAMTFDEYVDRIALMAANIDTFKSQVGATADEIDAIKADHDNAIYIRDYLNVTDGNKKTITAMKGSFFSGDAGEDLTAFPTWTAGAWPHTPAMSGALARFQELCRRYKAAPDYTEDIGVALGIVVAHDAPDASTVKPNVDCDVASAGGYHMTVFCKNRGEANSWEGFWRVAGTSDWSSMGVYTQRSANVTWPNGDGKPVLLEVRAQGRKNDQPYGQMSDIVQVNLNP